MVRLLSDAVLDMSWERFPLSLTTTIQLTYYTFFTAFESSLVVRHQHMIKLSMTHSEKSLASYMVIQHDGWNVMPDSKLVECRNMNLTFALLGMLTFQWVNSQTCWNQIDFTAILSNVYLYRR